MQNEAGEFIDIYIPRKWSVACYKTASQSRALAWSFLQLVRVWASVWATSLVTEFTGLPKWPPLASNL